MFTKEDILARLQNGETADDIANEMATALNEATAEKKALDAEAAAKEVEDARVLSAKRTAVDNMLDAMCDYLVAAGEGDLIEEVKEIDTDKVIELLDGTIEFAKGLEALKNLEFGFNIPTVEKKGKCGNLSCECKSKPNFPTNSSVVLTSKDAKWDPDLVIDNFLRNI